jgi:hypothetical protein
VRLLFFINSPFRRRFAPKESRGERPVRLCDPSYFVTPAAQIAVRKISDHAYFSHYLHKYFGKIC